MPTLITSARSIFSSAELVEPIRYTSDLPGRMAGASLRFLNIWRTRRRHRRALADLAERDEHLLNDIGVTRGDLLIEAEKPFWQP
jgi:uncharacterized protein YjiS (DUF1127 family)